MTAPRDLVFPEAVEDGADLFGRDRQVDQIRAVLRRSARQIVVVLGGRLVGKTSLLNVVTQWAEAEASYVVVRLAHAGTREALMAEIAHGMYERVGADRATARVLSGRDGTFHTATVAQFVRVVQDFAARARDRRFLLCVDELDSLLQGCTDHTSREVLDLILHLTAQTKLPIRFLFTMSRIPVRIRHSYGSPFLNKANIVELRPWSRPPSEEFADWLLAGRLRLDGAGHTALYAAAGGHPYFTKAVLRELLRAHPVAAPDAAPPPEAIDDAARAAVRSREVDIALSNMATGFLPEDAAAVLERVAAAPAGLVAGALRDLPAPGEVLDTLTEAGLLASDGRRYALRLGLWRLWRGTRRSGRSRRPPGRLAWLGRILRWPGGRVVRVVVLSVLALLLALAFGPGLLFPEQERDLSPCGGAARDLRLTVSHPSFVSIGDEHELRVSVTNAGRGSDDLHGSVVIDFPAGGVTMHDDNTLSFDGLQPNGQQIQVVRFTAVQPGRLLPDTSAGLPVDLTIKVGDTICPPHRFSLPVAPLPYLRNLKGGVVALVLLLPAPMVLEVLVRRFRAGRPDPPAGRR
jgi:hypothetical protein